MHWKLNKLIWASTRHKWTGQQLHEYIHVLYNITMYALKSLTGFRKPLAPVWIRPWRHTEIYFGQNYLKSVKDSHTWVILQESRKLAVVLGQKQTMHNSSLVPLFVINMKCEMNKIPLASLNSVEFALWMKIIKSPMYLTQTMYPLSQTHVYSVTIN